MAFGALTDGDLCIAPKMLPGEGFRVWNPSAEMYLEQGWKPVAFTDEPQDAPKGFHYESGWEEQTDAIVQTWELAEDPDEVTAEEIAAAIQEAMS